MNHDTEAEVRNANPTLSRGCVFCGCVTIPFYFESLRCRRFAGACALAALLVFGFSPSSRAQYSYATNNDEISITGYTGSEDVIVIPSTVAGLPVTSISMAAFYGCWTLTSVTIPEGVRDIAGSGFYDCINLTNVSLPGSVTNIGDHSFEYCISLTSVAIPNSVRTLGAFAFEFCPGLTNVTIGDGVTLIADQTFLECTELARVRLGAGVRTITDLAFKNCTNLASIAIPSSVTNLGVYAFYLCPNLEAIQIDPSNNVYTSVNGVVFNKNTNNVIKCPEGKTNYVIPDFVTAIGDRAFDNCARLTNVTIGTGVCTIADLAFRGCTALTTITIPGAVTNVGAMSFENCANLYGINVDPANGFYSSIDGVLFNKSARTLVRFPEGRTGAYIVPDGVTAIGTYAFWNCPGLNGLYFEGNAPRTGHSIFYNASPSVYYLPGTTGWGSTFGGCPTVAWYRPNPTVLSFGQKFGVNSNRFGFVISWATNASVAVDASTSLYSAVWQPIETNPLVGGWFYFSDSGYINFDTRFYRARVP